MAADLVRLCQLRPDQRTDEKLDELVKASRHLDALANLAPSEHNGLARVWTYEAFEGGARLCSINDEQPEYFIVVSGSVEVEEYRLCHNLGEEDVTPSGAPSSAAMRMTTVGEGRAFGQHALVHESELYDYSARAAPCGCAVLRIGKAAYARLLRKREERLMNEAVRMLKASPFFSSWSVASLQRLYFMLERRRLQPGEDVVTQGDLADFCFIIASGKCDIVVNIPPAPEKGILEATERFITTLPAGALVGEAGLLSATGRRNATVRASGRPGRDAPIDVLVLSKDSFLELDEATLNDIRETAQYNSACSMEPIRRTEADLDLLQRRTAHLDYCKQLPAIAHRELCRVMRYRKIAPETTLIEKGSPTSKMYVVYSGQAAVYAAGQASKDNEQLRRRNSISGPVAAPPAEEADDAAQPAVRKRRSSLAAVAQMTRMAVRMAKTQPERSRPTSMLGPGEVVGEAEMLFGEAKNAASVVATSELTVIEVARDDFERVLKPHRADRLGDLYKFLQSLPPFAGLSAFELQALGKLAAPRTVIEGQLCLASLPEMTGDHQLGALPYSADTVYIIRSGEARLLCSVEDSATDTPEEGGNHGTGSPAGRRSRSNSVALANRALEAVMGRTAPLATLCTNEVITADLLSGDVFTESDARWCLLPRTNTELLLFPRREWEAAIRSSAKDMLRDLAKQRAGFNRQRLEDAKREAVSISESGKKGPPGRLKLVGVIKGVPTVAPATPHPKAEKPLRTSESTPALRHRDSFYSGEVVERSRNETLRQELEAMRKWQQYQAAAMVVPRKAALPGIGHAQSAPKLVWRDGVPEYVGLASPHHKGAGGPLSGRPVTPNRAAMVPRSDYSALAAGAPKEAVDWHLLDDSTSPIKGQRMYVNGDTPDPIRRSDQLAHVKAAGDGGRVGRVGADDAPPGCKFPSQYSSVAMLALANTPPALRRDLVHAKGLKPLARSASYGVDPANPPVAAPAFAPSVGYLRNSPCAASGVAPQPRSLRADLMRNRDRQFLIQ